jgi:flavin-binding protein dodecin
MERDHQKNNIAGNSDKSFGEDNQYPVTKASESQPPIDWFKMAEQSMILSRLLANHRGRLNGTNL